MISDTRRRIWRAINPIGPILVCCMLLLVPSALAAEDAAAEASAEELLPDLHEGDNTPFHAIAPSPEDLLDSALPGVGLTPEAFEQGFDGLGESAPAPSHPMNLAARLAEEGAFISDGLVWRVYRALPERDGTFQLISESDEARPALTLPADEYIVHVSYGLANTAQLVSLRAGAADAEIALDVGGLRIRSVGMDAEDLSGRDLSLAIYSSEQDEYGQRKMIVENAAPDSIVRLNPGTYHVVSRYGDANAIVRANIPVQTGQLTEAVIEHRAAEITLKLVNELGGEALANTTWSVMAPDGDVVVESFGAFPTHVLAAGEYTVIARHEGRVYNRDFSVSPGINAEIELVAR